MPVCKTDSIFRFNQFLEKLFIRHLSFNRYFYIKTDSVDSQLGEFKFKDGTAIVFIPSSIK